MKRLKTADYVIQWILIGAGFLLTLLLRSETFFFGSYFVVGGWQVASVIVHFLLPAGARGRLRKVYIWSLALVAILGLAALNLSEFSILYLFGLLLVAPVLAVFYAILCMKETKAIEQTEQ